MKRGAVDLEETLIRRNLFYSSSILTYLPYRGNWKNNPFLSLLKVAVNLFITLP